MEVAFHLAFRLFIRSVCSGHYDQSGVEKSCEGLLFSSSLAAVDSIFSAEQRRGHSRIIDGVPDRRTVSSLR